MHARGVQGLVGLAKVPGAVALAEINCETDFVARAAHFHALLPTIARGLAEAAVATAAGNAGVREVGAAELAACRLPDGRSVRATALARSALRVTAGLRGRT
jgi:translation elongation factor EF-Ts